MIKDKIKDRFNTRDRNKFIYWIIIPLLMGGILFSYLDKFSWSIYKKILVFLLIMFPISIIRVIVGEYILFKEKNLADTIMNCSLRKAYGYNYCPKCPDSYNCAKNFRK